MGNLINATPLHPGYRSGVYYVTDPYIISSSPNQNILNNTLYYFPIFIPQSLSVDRIGVYVGSAVTGAIARLGLFTNSNGLPKNLIVDSGDILCTSIGFKESIISTNLAPGYYWIGMNSSVAVPSLYTVSARLGSKFIVGESSPSVGNVVTTLQQNSVTYGAMPAIAPISSIIYGNNPPVFWLRAA